MVTMKAEIIDTRRVINFSSTPVTGLAPGSAEREGERERGREREREREERRKTQVKPVFYTCTEQVVWSISLTNSAAVPTFPQSSQSHNNESL